MPASNLTEYRHGRTGSLNIPPASANGGHPSSMAGGPRFDGPRSPPNTSHVPCKFFRQGACQAGNACPFSHDISSETICKYFSKGNCKFGPKCANIHVLPDGRRINYGKNGVTIGPSPINFRQTSGHYTSSSTSTLGGGDTYRSTAYPYPISDERQHQLGRQPSLENSLPTIDTTNYSHPGSNYGSPRDDDSNRFGLGLSPANGNGLSVLDAPLPASFDSNGISNAARYPAAPWPSSVPSKFGLDSPSPSLISARESRPSEAVKALHNSAYPGGVENGPSSFMAATGSSPPNHAIASGEYFAKRTLHSITKFGSPGANLATSPGPWGSGPLYQRQKEDERPSAAAKASAFGHVGSPLRNSSLAAEMGERNGYRATAPVGARSGSYDGNPMSVLSEQLRRTRVSEDGGSPHLHPNAARAVGKDRERVVERHVSSGSIGSSQLGRFTTPIDEEDGNFLFSMDEDEQTQQNSSRLRKRGSSGFGVGSTWSYGAVAPGKGSGLRSSPKDERGSPVVETVGGR